MDANILARNAIQITIDNVIEDFDRIVPFKIDVLKDGRINGSFLRAVMVYRWIRDTHG